MTDEESKETQALREILTAWRAFRKAAGRAYAPSEDMALAWSLLASAQGAIKEAEEAGRENHGDTEVADSLGAASDALDKALDNTDKAIQAVNAAYVHMEKAEAGPHKGHA
jgi:hypothetical protein